MSAFHPKRTLAVVTGGSPSRYHYSPRPDPGSPFYTAPRKHFPTRPNYDPDRFMLCGPTIRLPTSLPRSPRRRRRAGEWTAAKAVTFIVTLAARQSVTLAAARAGMSRKSAYALKGKDCAFAAAWNAALSVGAIDCLEGDESNDRHNPPIAPPLGDSLAPRIDLARDAKMRDDFFRALATRAGLRRSPSSQ